MMAAHPKRGDAYRQEYYRGHAEDQARVLGNTGQVTVPAGTYQNTIGTKEKSRLEPGIAERKWTPLASARSRARTSRAARRASGW